MIGKAADIADVDDVVDVADIANAVGQIVCEKVQIRVPLTATAHRSLRSRVHILVNLTAFKDTYEVLEITLTECESTNSSLGELPTMNVGSPFISQPVLLTVRNFLHCTYRMLSKLGQALH